MGRPQRNNVDFFPHDCISSSRLITIISKFGIEGYATYYRLRERLGHESYHCLSYNEEEKINLAVYCFVEEDKLDTILSFFSKLGVINKDLFEKHHIIFSESFIEYIKEAYIRRTNMCIDLEGLCRHLSINGKHITSSHVIPFGKKPHSIVENSIEKNSIVKDSTQKIDFFSFWNLYDKKAGDPEDLKKQWNQLSAESQQAIIDYLPEYIKSTPNKQFRKNPKKFIETKSWLNEIIPIEPKEEKIEPKLGILKVGSNDLDQLKELLNQKPTDD